jgi:hypothetical protein
MTVGTLSLSRYREPPRAIASEPQTSTIRRPRRSDWRPAKGRQTIEVSAKAPTTMPTARSPACSGPRTKEGSTGSAAPIARKASRAVTKTPADAAAPVRAAASEGVEALNARL